MTTENWRGELIREMPFLSEQSLGTINTLLSKERNEAMKLNYWDKEKRNEVLEEVKKLIKQEAEKLCGEYHDEKGTYVMIKLETMEEILILLENLKVK